MTCLPKSFLNVLLKKKNLYNAIQKFRGVRIHDKSDAAVMFSYLMKLYNEDPEYIVIPRLEGPSNELTGLFWMTSQQRNDLGLNFMMSLYYTIIEQKLIDHTKWALS